MTSRTQAPASERGAVLVHTAFALLALVAFTTFVADYGVLWLSRRQAQNSADAGALAGALALAFEDSSDFTSNGLAKKNAHKLATTNLVYGDAPAVDIDTDIEVLCPTCPNQCPNGSLNTCIRVDVFRNQAHGNPLPIFFGGLVGISQQGIRATATAEVSGANSSRCMLPWVLADRWADVYDEFHDTATFPNDNLELFGDPIGGWSHNDLYQDASQTPGGDYYTPPYNSGHTGWTMTGDYGRQLILHDELPGQFSPGWSMTVNLPNLPNGMPGFHDAFDCSVNTTQVAIADEFWNCSDPSHGYPNDGTSVQEAIDGCLGAATGWGGTNTSHAINGGGQGGAGLLAQDPGAHWDPGALGGQGAVVDGGGNVNMSSPRIRPLAVFDVTPYIASGCTGTGCVTKVVNIIGFFIEGTCNNVTLDPGLTCHSTQPSQWGGQVVGRIVTLPGSYYGSGGNPVTDSTFLKIVRLIR